MIHGYQQQLKQGKSLVDVTTDLVKRIEYKNFLGKQYPDPNEQQSRLSSVEEVVNAIGVYQREHKKASLAGFLDEVTLGDKPFDNEKENQLARNAVALMTYHSAKGLEFRYVYMRPRTTSKSHGTFRSFPTSGQPEVDTWATSSMPSRRSTRSVRYPTS